ncbi:MAG: hypothetical protein IJS31_05575, partial [Oscillospiraceae bacterium]|nr:hypothetical protein [Oscillospiraceae bacterium]
MKVPQPRKLKSGTWFCQLRLGVASSVSAIAARKLGCVTSASGSFASPLSNARSNAACIAVCPPVSP